jgi:hypothetical protein
MNASSSGTTKAVMEPRIDHHTGSENPAVGGIDIGFNILIDRYPEFSGSGFGSQQHDHKGVGDYEKGNPGRS